MLSICASFMNAPRSSFEPLDDALGVADVRLEQRLLARATPTGTAA